VVSAISKVNLNRYDKLYERLGTQDEENKFTDWLKLEKINPENFSVWFLKKEDKRDTQMIRKWKEIERFFWEEYPKKM